MASSRHHREKRKIRAGAIIALFLIVIYGKANCCRTLLALFQAFLHSRKKSGGTRTDRGGKKRQRKKNRDTVRIIAVGARQWPLPELDTVDSGEKGPPPLFYRRAAAKRRREQWSPASSEAATNEPLPSCVSYYSVSILCPVHYGILPHPVSPCARNRASATKRHPPSIPPNSLLFVNRIGQSLYQEKPHT